MSREPSEGALWISERAKIEAPTCQKMLLLGIRNDGSSYSDDTGLTADEAINLVFWFIRWIDDCLEASRKTREED